MLPIGRAETSVGRRFLGSSRREPKLACVRWRPRHGFAIAQVGKTIYAVSGVNNAGAAGTLSVFPSTRSTSPDNTICSSRMSYLMPIVDSDGNDAAMLLRVGLRPGKRPGQRGAPKFQGQSLRQRPWSARHPALCRSGRWGSPEASWPPGPRARGRRAGVRSPTSRS